MQEPENSQTPASNSRRVWGWWLLGGGLLTAVIAIGNLAVSSTLLLGDLMSGGAVPGHGQAEINQSALVAGSASMFLVLGILAVVAGLVLLAHKRGD